MRMSTISDGDIIIRRMTRSDIDAILPLIGKSARYEANQLSRLSCY